MINLGQLYHIAVTDPQLYEVLKQLATSQDKLNNYHGIDTSGIVKAPAAIGSLTVTATNGRFIATIIDKSPVNKGINYFIEYDTSASFLTAIQVALGPSRVFDKFLGSGTYFFRGYSSYPLSLTSPKVLSTPISLAGGGAIAGPGQPVNQGSGTATLPGKGFGDDTNQPPGEFPGFRRGRDFGL